MSVPIDLEQEVTRIRQKQNTWNAASKVATRRMNTKLRKQEALQQMYMHDLDVAINGALRQIGDRCMQGSIGKQLIGMKSPMPLSVSFMRMPCH